MKKKYLLFTGIMQLFFALFAHAQKIENSTSFEIHSTDGDVLAICDGSVVILKIGRLGSLTHSGSYQFYLETYNPGVCVAIATYIKGPRKMVVLLETSLTKNRKNYGPMECKTRECKMSFDAISIENISVTIDQIEFLKQTPVPGSTRRESTVWPSNTCPPWAPDCDL